MTTATPDSDPKSRGVPEDVAQRYRERQWWRDITNVHDFLRVAETAGDKPAVVSHRAGEDEVFAVTYAELAHRAACIADGLRELGIGRGDRVSCQLPNWWQFPTIALATASLGAVFNPIIPIFRRREVGYVLGRLESKVCIVPSVFRGHDYAGTLKELRHELPSLAHVFVVGGDVQHGLPSFEEFFLERQTAPRLSADGLDPDDLVEVQFTSGTTGEPKGVMHSYNTQYARTRAMWEPLGLDREDTVLMSSTLAHSSGFLYGYLVPLTRGMTAVYQDVWDPDVMLDLVERYGVTWSMGTTTFVVDAVRAQRARPRDTSSFRFFVSGGAAIPPALVHETQKTLGARLMAVWGMTENGGVTITRPEDHLDAAAESDGRPVEWMETRIVDDGGAPVPAGVVGRLLVRGASQTLGYYKRPEIYEAQLTEDGWFDTGDLARADAHGNIRITGRTKDLIVRGGENIPPAEIEAALFTHPAVHDIAVVGYPDERLGERACAVVVPAEGASVQLTDLLAHLEQAGMSKTYWPERLEMVDALPRTLSGKVQKYKLREQLAG